MTEHNVTPRDLDPNFVDATVPADAVQDPAPEVPVEDPAQDVPMITHSVPFIDEGGVQRVKVYGPMPVSEYAEWERKFQRGEVK